MEHQWKSSCDGKPNDDLEMDDSRVLPVLTEVDSSAVKGTSRPDRDDENSSLPSLPIELLNNILLYSTTWELCQVSKSSRLCHAVATPLLYREIELVKPVKIVQLNTTLSRRPDIALHVRRYHVGEELADGAEVLSSYYDLLHKALRQMNGLVFLSLLMGGPRSFVLTGCSFRLKSFTTACHWDITLVRWLETQDEITSALFCGKYHHEARISPKSLPKLRRVSAPPLILAAVVPNRPVHEAELCLHHPWLLNSEVISTTLRILAFSSAVVRTLQFITHLTESSETTLEALRTIPEHLPELATLAIQIVSGFVTKEILDGLDSVFSSFKSLQSVMFLSKDSSDFLHKEEMTSSLAEIWHKSCPSLEVVSFPDSIWVRNSRLGWVTLKELERILSAKERDLEQKEKDLAEREKAIMNRQLSLNVFPIDDLFP